jgi:hypothetical protein
MKTIQRTALTAVILFGSNAYGEEIDYNFESTRQRGRGNTYTAATYSHETPRWNPAVLSEAKPKTVEFRWFEFDVMVGQNSVDTVSDIMSALGSSSDEMLGNILETFSDKFGKRQYLRFQLLPIGLRFGGFVLEPFVTNYEWLEMRIPTLPIMALESDTRAGVGLSYGFPVGKNMRLGMTVRPTYRYFVSADVAATDVIQIAASEAGSSDDIVSMMSGMYVPVDLGMIWSNSPSFRFGATWHNVGDAAVTEEAADASPLIKSDLSLGMMYRKKVGSWNLDTSADLRDMLFRQSSSFLRKLHGGVEFGRPYFTTDNDIGVQVGVSEGWYSLGGFVDIWLARLAVSNYGVELGEVAGQRQDRRWGVTMQSSVTF